MTRFQAWRRSERKGVWLAGVGLVVLLGGLYVAGHELIGDRVPTGTSIAGVSIGGMEADEATAKLRAELGPRSRRPIKVYDGAREFVLRPSEVGLSFDPARTVERAGGVSSWNPLDMLTFLVGGGAGSTVPAVRVESGRLSAAVTKIARTLDSPAVEPRIRWVADDLQVRRPVPGREVDTEALRTEIRDGYLGDTLIEVPVTRLPPSVGLAKTGQAKRGLVSTLMDAPLTVTADGRRATIGTARLTQLVSVRAVDGRLVNVVAPDRLRFVLRRVAGQLSTRPRNAAVVMGPGPTRIRPGRPGVRVVPRLSDERLLEVLRKTSPAGRTVRLASSTVAPAITTKDVREMVRRNEARQDRRDRQDRQDRRDRRDDRPPGGRG